MEQPWVVVLAGGEGTRIRSLTRAPDGTPVPKQFCRLRDGTSLFHRAVARGLSVTTGSRIVPVVRPHHRRWWERDLRGLSPQILVAPRECGGTAQAVYGAAREVARRDPDAVVLFLPSDHVVDDEAGFRAAAARLCAEARGDPESLMLLGIAGEEPDPEYGWIVPSAESERGIRRVLAFVEKPTRAQAEALLRRGALVNALVVAANAKRLLARCDAAIPELAADRHVAGEVRPRPGRDFSRDFLSRTTAHQRVLEAPSLGWCDLGTPDRLRNWMVRHGEFFWWSDGDSDRSRASGGIAQPAVP